MLVTGAVVAVALSACGGSSGAKQRSTDTGVGASDQQPKVVAPVSARKAVDGLVAGIRVGSPAAIAAYDPELIDKVGKGALVVATDSMQGPLKNGQLRFVTGQETPVGQQLVYRLSRKPAKGAKAPPPQTLVYLLNRKGGQWVVTFDSTLTQTLAGNAASEAVARAQRKIDPHAKKVSNAARAAAAGAGSAAMHDALAAIPVPTKATAANAPRSPKRALESLWASIRLGSPAAIAAYRPDVVRKIGATDLLVALQSLKARLGVTKLRLTNVTGTKAGVQVTVRQQIKGAPAKESVYLLDRKGGHWSVLYDGIVTDTLVGFATRDALSKASRGSKSDTPSQAARAAGAAAGQKERRRLASVLPASLQASVTGPTG
jgi:hypothetical protein